MRSTIRSLVVSVSDLGAAKAVYAGLFGAPHTDQSYYVGYNVEGCEVSLAPGDVAGGPVAFADVQDLDATRATCSRLVLPSAAPRVRSRPGRGCACSPTRTATIRMGSAGRPRARSGAPTWATSTVCVSVRGVR